MRDKNLREIVMEAITSSLHKNYLSRIMNYVILVLLVVSFAEADMLGGDNPPVNERPLNSEFEQASRVYTQLAWATYLRSNYLRIDKKQSDVKRAYEEVLRVYEQSAFLHTQLASLLIDTHNIRAAEKQCRRAIAINPEMPAPHFLLGYILILRQKNSTGNLDDAIAEFEKVIELNSNHATVYFGGIIVKCLVDSHRYLGTLAYNREDYESAVHAFKELTRIESYQPIYHKGLGDAYKDLGKNEEAISAYERAVRIDRNMAQVYQELGKLYIAEYEKLENQIWNYTGTTDTAEIAEENLLKGINAYTELRRLHPAERDKYDFGLAVFRTRLGSLYTYLSKEEKAIEVLQGVLDEDSDNVDANYWIGLSYQAGGNFEKAEYYLRRAVALAPNRDEGYNALGYLFAEYSTNLDEAVELIKKALEKSPGNGAYLDSLGWAYFKQGKLTAALEHLEKAVSYIPNSVEIQDHLGEVYLKVGYKKKAIAAWRKAIQLEPDNVKIQEKLIRLEDGESEER